MSWEIKSPGEKSPLEDLPLNVSRETKFKLQNFIGLIFEWQKKINLTGAKNPHDFCHHHLFDAIASLKVVTLGPACLDIGSGVGIPGLIWALMNPNTSFYLIEARQKRAGFLQRAVSKMRIQNAQVLPIRFEKVSPKQIGEHRPQIVSRGTLAPKNLWKLILESPVPFKEWLVFTTAKTHREFVSLGRGSPLKVSKLTYFRKKQEEGILTKITPKRPL